MLRPSFPGGVPYPPRPGEAGHPSGGVRYAAVYPPGGAPGQAPPTQYTQRDGQVFVRQPPTDSRTAERTGGARMTLRQAPYPIYQEYRDGVQVVGVGGRGDQVHVVAPPSTLPGMHPHPGLGVGGVVAHAEVTQNASKRPRMGGDALAPLRIDTRDTVKEPGYHPQVEAISPTPEDRTAERDDVRSTKDDLLQKISKVDREIAKAESQIAKLKKKQHDLEDAANRPTSDSASEEAAVNQSIAQNVYSENRRKAGQSHASLEKFSAKNDLPLYNQPSDTEVYSTNKKNYTVFKKKLVEYFKKSQSEREARDRYLTVTYCKLTSQWTKKVDRVENSRKRKEREGRSREMYEKIFPELRKQREDKERDARLGTRGVVKSDADFEDVIERLQEQEVRLKMEDKKMHSYAVIPPLLLPPDERRRKFTNTNGLIQDPMLIYNERKYVNMWTDQERETFKEKYLQHPKNFGLIAQYLERKTVSDCVQYYYLSKKTENYKQLLRKTRTRPRGPRRTQAPGGEVIGPNIPGVVTRRKVEELQGKEMSGENNSKGNSRSNTPAPLANNVKTEENGETSGNEKENGKKKPDRARDSKKTENQNDSSDEEESNQAVKTGPHPCVLCKAVVDSSRAVTKSHSVQLGLKEEELVNDARVCNTCWCKTLKKKHAAVCPVPACTSSKGRNRGKLRHLPSKWAELDSKSKETIVAELQLPENTKRVCTACFTRITRRISQLEGVSGEVKKEKEEPVNWSESEIESARESLRNHGTNWGRMAEAVKVKTEEQCKKFFYNQRKRLQLDKVVTEYKRATRPEGSDKPSLTSDEESGSTTSSCEEDPALTIETDTQASAAAPKQDPDLKPPAVPPVVENKAEPENVKKVEEGYDSAATMSADETGDPVGAPPKVRQGAPVPPGAANTCRANNMPMTVNDLMETVISHTLQTPGTSTSAVSVAPVVVTTAPPRPDIPSLDSILKDAGPSPHYKNFVKEAMPVAKGLVGKEPPHGSSPGLPPISRPDIEVRQVVPQAPPQQPMTDVLDLTVSRPDRSSPAPSASGPPEHPSYPGFSKLVEPRPETFGKEPPAAHGGPKAKTTHMEMMMQDPTFPHLFPRKDNKSPAPYTDPRASVHSPGPQMIRGDPRKEINPKSQPPPLHPNNKTLATHPGLQITPSRGGSLLHGTPHGPPKAQQVHAGPPQHSPRTYDGQNPHNRGSIQTGKPVFNNLQGQRGHPSRPPEAGRNSHPAMDPYKQSNPAYPPYQSPRPASHEAPPSGTPLINSSRRIIETDYNLAQNLPRKDHPRDQGSGFPRTIDPHPHRDPRSESQRFAPDSRNAMYGGTQRFPFGGRGDSIRGDPRADIPGRDPNARGDPRDMYRPDPRLPVDPREARPDPRAPMMDPRARPPYSGHDPRMPPHSREQGRRSPPRSTSMANSHHPGIPPQPSARGSITQGVPNSKVRDVDIYSPRHPEVSITKQPSAGSREYQNTSLSDLAEVAAVQQRIQQDGRDHRQNAVSRAETGSSRGPITMPMMDPRAYDPRRADMEKRSAELGPPRAPSRDSQRSEAEERERHHRNMVMKLNQMSDSEKQQYLAAISGGATRSDQMTASHLIDLIITHQINKNTVGPPGAGPPNPRRSPQAAADGKDSPSKAPSRSPSVKSMTERDGMEGGASGSAIRTSPGTMGEHIENMINKEVNRNSTTSPYPGPSNPSENHEHWKRRGYPPDQASYSQARPPSQPRPPSNSHPGLSTDERQILRVAQNASPRPDKPPSRSSMHEAISPPTSEPGRGHPSHPSYYPPQQDQAMARFLAARRKQEADAAAAAAAKSGFGVSHFMDDYVKHKITEVMKNEKSGGAGPSDLSKPGSHGGPMGPPHKRPLEVEARGSPAEHPSANTESPRKRYKQDEAGGSNDMPDSPESGDMVIDESARPDSAHSHKTNSPAPNADPSHFPPGYRGGPPPRSSPAPGQSSRPPPQNPAALARYEPLSDDD